MCVVANEYGRTYDYQNSNDNDHGNWRYDWDASGFGLNGTPFIQTLLASRGIITAFQNKHQLDVCNVVYLTDGEGGNSLNYPPMSVDSGFYDDRRKSVVYLIDKKDQEESKVVAFSCDATCSY